MTARPPSRSRRAFSAYDRSRNFVPAMPPHALAGLNMG